MRYTNEHRLPAAVYNLIANPEYDRGDADLSVTEIIDSPRVRVLKKKHNDEIEVEASTGLAAALGTALHKALEKSSDSGTSEKRYFTTVDGLKLSGAVDHYENGVIRDYKTANVFKVMYAEDGRVEEWEKQLNVYAYLMREHGHVVNELRIFVLFKDWNKRGFSEAFKKGKLWHPGKSAGYPDKAWADFKLRLWPEEEAISYVQERVALHKQAEIELPRCSVKDVWRGVRCSSYCDVAKFCDQYQESRKTGLLSPEEK